METTIKMRGRAVLLAFSAIMVVAFASLFAASSAYAATLAHSNLTVTGLNTGDVVEAYAIAETSINDSTNELVFDLDSNVPTAYDSKEKILAVNTDAGKKAMADAIAAAFLPDTVTASDDAIADSNGQAVLDLPSGYYLVRVTDPANSGVVYQNMIVDNTPAASGTSWAPHADQTVDVKESAVSIDKKVNGADSTDEFGVGEIVPCSLDVLIPNYPAGTTANIYFAIFDEPTTGLKLLGSPSDSTHQVTIKIGNDTVPASAYTYDLTDNKMSIVFGKDYIASHGGQRITITYNAQVTKDAYSRTATDLTENDVRLAYNANPYNDVFEGSDEPDPDALTYIDDEAPVYTYGYVFAKYKGDESATSTGEALEGAEFTLYDANGAVVKDENGNAITSTSTIVNGKAYVYFSGLANGKTYTAKETKVPAGYLKASDQTFTVVATDYTADNPATASQTENNFKSGADAVDPKAPNLPITGGMGIFLLTGAGLLLIGCGTFLVLRARRSDF